MFINAIPPTFLVAKASLGRLDKRFNALKNVCFISGLEADTVIATYVRVIIIFKDDLRCPSYHFWEQLLHIPRMLKQAASFL